MLLLNLGFQGLVFFLLASYIYKINSIYLIICGLVSFLIILSAFQNNIEISFTETNCLRWDFLTNLQNASISLGLMYAIIFLWIFTESNSEYIKYVGFILLGTFLFSYFILSGK